MATTTYSIGDLVWAKMKGFPPWPGLITEPTDELRKIASKTKAAHCIYFFGTKNYSWIEADKLKAYEALPIQKQFKSSALLSATKEIQEYINGNKNIVTPTEDPFDQLISDTPPKKGKRLDTGKKKLSIGEDTQTQKSVINTSPTEVSSPANKTKLGKTSRRSSGKLDESSSDSPRRASLPKQESVRERRATARETKEPRKRPSTTPPPESKIKRRSSGSLESCRPPTPPLHPSDDIIPISPPSPDLNGAINGLGRLSPALLSNNLRSPLSSSLLDLSEDHEIISYVKKKNIIPSNKVFGFLGVGVLGSGIVKNLMSSGHKVVLWNRTPDKCTAFVEAGAEFLQTPSDVVSCADITYCCVNDPNAAKDLVFGNCGVLSEMGPEKAYVEMSGIDSESSLNIAEAIMSTGGKYLEVRFLGSKEEAEEGTLMLMASGDRQVFDDCQSCVAACSNYSVYLGEVGQASNLVSIIQLMMGITLAGVAECLTLAERCGFSRREVSKIVKVSQLNCKIVTEKLDSNNAEDHSCKFALSYLQKNMKYALDLADKNRQRMNISATANEMFKHTKKIGYGHKDVSAIFIGARY